MQSKTIIGLDVGSYAVKAVALTPNKERITLSGYAQDRIGTQDPAVVVRKVLDQLGVRGKRIVTSVSGRSVIVRQVETPRLGPEELKTHIAYEADKYIPFGTDEVIIDCQPLPDRANAKATNMQVLLVAVRRGFVEDHITTLRNAGLSPEVIDVDVFAVANAYELLGPGSVDGADQQATALIDVGASKSNIAIVQGNRLLFTREVYLAGNEITDAIVRTFNESAEDVERIKSAPGEALEALLDAAMPALEDLANEIRLSFDYVEGQFDQQVSSVVLTGGTSQLQNLSQILGNILGRPVHVFDPLAGMDLVPSKYDLHGLDANAPSLTVAIGLAAHLIGNNRLGLGGGQSHGWQPRNAGAAAGVMPRGAAAAAAPEPEPVAVAATPPPMAAVAGGESRRFEPLSMPQVATPPPPVFTPVAAPQMEDDAPAALEPDIRPGTAGYRADENPSQGSGLLVVLDDDQDMPGTDSQRKSTGMTTGRRNADLKVENFDDEDGGSKLPDLPKL
ncbi:MAG TPA: type IV pilus assembly protein PilM [Planctomycetota bacterium]|nr:type IV pilus assembly protein PilM [Planctomycetota bacterium]